MIPLDDLEGYIQQLEKEHDVTIEPSGTLTIIRAPAKSQIDYERTFAVNDISIAAKNGQVLAAKSAWPGKHHYGAHEVTQSCIIQVGSLMEYPVILNVERLGNEEPVYQLSICLWGGHNTEWETVAVGTSNTETLKELLADCENKIRKGDIVISYEKTRQNLMRLVSVGYGLDAVQHRLLMDIKKQKIRHLAETGSVELPAKWPNPTLDIGGKKITLYQGKPIQRLVIERPEGIVEAAFPKIIPQDQIAALTSVVNSDVNWPGLARDFPLVQYTAR